MPLHDWSRAPGWVWHQMQLGWALYLSDACNRLLPPDHYALIEYAAASPDSTRAFDLPDIAFTGLDEETGAAAKRRTVAVRRASDHRKVAVIEVLCPAIRNTPEAHTKFLAKAVATLDLGLGLLVIDPFPPGKFALAGIASAVWEAATGRPLVRSADQPLTFAAYAPGREPALFVTSVAVGDVLPDMPLHLGAGDYTLVPLEETYQSAWASFPAPLKPLLG